MFFVNLSFWVFFSFVFAVFSVIYKRLTLRNLFIFLVSVFFYYKTSGLFFILFLISIVYDFSIAKAMEKSQSEKIRKALVSTSVILNLGLLIYFHSAYFFTESVNEIFHTHYKMINYFVSWTSHSSNSHFDINRIILPAGLSFHTFQTISYTVDVYRRKIKPLNNIFDFGFFIMFFPHLVLGPIAKPSQFIPQMKKQYSLSQYQFGLALFMILTGLIKKLLVGDYMATNFIDKIFGNPLLFTGFENLMAVIGYSMQVYLDFSGYTDIGTGIALLLGFKLGLNFNSPYKAKNTAEFWKRWHISLSSWLQSYLYIPIGGNRSGSWVSYLLISLLTIVLSILLHAYWFIGLMAALTVVFIVLGKVFPSFRNAVNTNINLMVTMLIGGFWHGATLNFLIWGGLNGLGLVFYKFWRKISPYEKIKTWPVHAWKVFITFMFISFTRIYFRTEDMAQAKEVIDKLFYDLKFSVAWPVISNMWEVFTLMLIAFVIHWLPSSLKWQYKKLFIRSHVVVKILAVVCTVFIIYQGMSSESKPFIYFQF
ncbi:MAG: MBOAT family protein [Bacteroidia bacterium]|nr:MBOAT family protein [Bacteroidia bacterium]